MFGLYCYAGPTLLTFANGPSSEFFEYYSLVTVKLSAMEPTLTRQSLLKYCRKGPSITNLVTKLSSQLNWCGCASKWGSSVFPHLLVRPYGLNLGNPS